MHGVGGPGRGLGVQVSKTWRSEVKTIGINSRLFSSMLGCLGSKA